MSCQNFRDMVSSEIDGELPAAEADLLGAHLTSCDDCRAYRDAAVALRGTTEVATASPAPGALARTLRSVNDARDRWSMSWQEKVQYALAVISGTLVVLNIPVLFNATSAGAEAHASRHLGAFGLAFGCGLLYVALRPTHIMGVMPFAMALGVAMIGGALVDMSNGESTMLGEAVHALEFAALLLVGVLANDQRGSRAPALTDA